VHGCMCPNGPYCRQGFPGARDGTKSGLSAKDTLDPQDPKDSESRLAELVHKTGGSVIGYLFVDAVLKR